MYSVEVIRREKAAKLVIEAGRTHAATVQARLQERLAPALAGAPVPGASLPDAALLVLLSVRSLEQSLHALLRADEAHEAELSDDAPARATRDAARQALYATMVKLRSAMLPLYGEEACAVYGLSGETPVDPLQLRHFARRFVEEALRTPFPPSLMEDLDLDRLKWAARVDSEERALGEALSAVTREFREAEGTVEQKWAAMAAFDVTYRQVADFVAGILSLAGEDGLARRVKPQPAASAAEAASETADVVPLGVTGAEGAASAPAG